MTVLNAIVARKRADLALVSCPPSERIPRSRRSFEDAIAAPGLSLIAEIKQRGPSSPVRPPDARPFDVTALARLYDRSARAISVLTDGPFFGGDHAHLTEASGVSRRPILCKDFVIDPELQIPRARAHGADAILLMAQLLDGPSIERALGLARGLGMEGLVEVHDEEQLSRVLGETSARIVGINARDLRTLDIDLERPLRLAARARDAGRLVVAESGLRTRADLARIEGAVDAVLVGTALSMSPDPEAAIASLGFAPRAARAAIKLCGIRTEAQARAAIDAGADAIGLNFVEGARRAVPMAEARAMCALPVVRVGVFTSTDEGRLTRAVRSYRLNVLQLHGPHPRETLTATAELARREGVALWRAIEVTSTEALRSALEEATAVGARVVLDGPRSGSGRAIEARLLSGVVLPHDLVLAGGLSSLNVQAAIEAFEPAMVDVASDLEDAGVPSPERMRAFVRSVREGERAAMTHAGGLAARLET